ncbi:MAG: zinc finger Ran-binding domain-containing protein [Chloroflexi bacterium]|nr:zinc finger Ran-binding domain-containing protein [Chloroflexota bacterium]MCI0577142.1 zinc finger Ran-binding domain-containing protein [Chloroflexota bacterium]MCI0644682.1 zinc finger Ran-binding domain-containing protein [Chloroflexota bacterium]MCI0730380.1 zinc finger Ran-binding domain-containing protein [Chloroflexota bacterium]
MAVREGLWDCQWCGQTGILGRHKECSNCGRSRPEGTKFYLPGSAPAVADPQLLKIAKAGPDWLCEHCGSSNAAGRDRCASCDAPKGSSPSQAVKDYSPAAIPRTWDNASSSEETPQAHLPEPAALPAAPARKWFLPGGIVAAVAVLFFCGLLSVLLLANARGGQPQIDEGPPTAALFVFTPAPTIDPYREVTATVSGFSWLWSVSIEKLSPLVQTGASVPPGGRILNQTQVIDHYEQILDHYETRSTQVAETVQTGVRTYVCGQRDLGNGFFEDIECTEPVYETRYRTETTQEPVYRSDPVYVTQYTYEIDQWSYTRSEEVSGADQNPFWPTFTLAADEREAGRSQYQYVEFAGQAGNTYRLAVSQEEWTAYLAGDTYRLEVDRSNNVYRVLERLVEAYP